MTLTEKIFKPNEKNRVPEHLEHAVIALAIENPALEQQQEHQINWSNKV